MASQPRYELLTAEQFLEIDFGSDKKAELDNGVIRMMAGGTEAHARIAGNIFAFLRAKLRGSGCRPYTSDMATRTHDRSVRYPDVSIFCQLDIATRPPGALAFDDPRVIFEILSAGTARTDLRVKLDEYKALPSIDTIVFVDTATERVRVVQRTGAGAWSDVQASEPLDVQLPALSVTVPHAEIFARD